MPTAKIKAVHVIYKVKGRFRGKVEIDDNGQTIMHLKNNEKIKLNHLTNWSMITTNQMIRPYR